MFIVTDSLTVRNSRARVLITRVGDKANKLGETGVSEKVERELEERHLSLILSMAISLSTFLAFMWLDHLERDYLQTNDCTVW